MTVKGRKTSPEGGLFLKKQTVLSAEFAGSQTVRHGRRFLASTRLACKISARKTTAVKTYVRSAQERTALP